MKTAINNLQAKNNLKLNESKKCEKKSGKKKIIRPVFKFNNYNKDI